MKPVITALTALVICLPVTAQTKRFTYYFDEHLNPSPREAAFVYGKGIIQDSVIWTDFFLISNNSKIFSAAYKDSSLKVLHGKSIDYYPNGRVQQLKNYVLNIQSGLTEKWDSLGRLTDSMIYRNGNVVLKKKMHYTAQDAIINEIITDSINNTLLDIRYDTSGRKSSIIFFTGDKGIEKIYHPDGSETNGDSLYTREGKDAAFPGGQKAWAAYLTRTLDAVLPIRNGAPPGQYKVLVRFIVDTEGNLFDIRALSHSGYGTEQEAIRVIRKSGKWTPAKQYGRFVKAYRIQPIIFSISKR